MHYDIAEKVLIEKCREAILSHFLNIVVDHSIVLEDLPQETVSLRRSDYAIRVMDADGRSFLVLLELKSAWEKDSLLQVLEYRTRYQLKHHLPVVSCLVLLKETGAASEVYEDEEVRFHCRLVRIYEWEAQEVVDRKLTCLLPFIPLMRHGKNFLLQAEEMLYHSDMGRQDRADMLTSMAILSGLASSDLPLEIIRRRKDLMVESAAYNLIKQEGFQEGIEKGIERGIEKGIERSVQKMFMKGLSPEEIAHLLDMDIKTVLSVHGRLPGQGQDS